MPDPIPDDMVRRVRIQDLERELLHQHTRLVQTARAVHAIRENINMIERDLAALKEAQ